MTIMSKRGNLDNIVTYEHICDTTADMQNIDPHYVTLGSTCIVLVGESGGLEIYLANSAKEWSIVGAMGSSADTEAAIAEARTVTETLQAKIEAAAGAEENLDDIIASIPQDYSSLSSEVTDLTNNFNTYFTPTNLAAGVQYASGQNWIRYDTGALEYRNYFKATESFIDISGCTKIVYTHLYSDTTTEGGGIAFYSTPSNNSEAFISGISMTYSGTEIRRYEYKVVDVPENANYIRCTGRTTLGDIEVYDADEYFAKIPQKIDTNIKNITTNTKTLAIVNLINNDQSSLINYGYDSTFESLQGNPASGDGNRVSVERCMTIVKISCPEANAVKRVRLTGGLQRNSGNTTLQKWPGALQLTAGEDYKIRISLISGTAVNSLGDSFVPTVQVLLPGTFQTFGQDMGYDETGARIIKFTAPSEMFNMCVYIAEGHTFTDCIMNITLQKWNDVTNFIQANQKIQDLESMHLISENVNNLINYGYSTTKQGLKGNFLATDGSQIAVERYLTLVKLNSENTNHIIRIRLTNELSRTISTSTAKQWINGIQLIKDQNYKICISKISGVCINTNTQQEFIPNISIYPPNQSKTIGTQMTLTDTTRIIKFTAPADPINICFYIPSNTTLTDYIMNVTLQPWVETAEDIQPADYFLDELNDTIQKAYTELSTPALTFLWCTDLHRYSSKATAQTFTNMIKNMNFVSKQIPINFLLNTGDLTDGNKTQSVTLNRAHNCINEFKSLNIPYVFAMGNHDTNYYGSHNKYFFTMPEVFSAYFYNTQPTSYNLNENGTDYYIDFDIFNTRLIVLNANTNSRVNNTISPEDDDTETDNEAIDDIIDNPDTNPTEGDNAAIIDEDEDENEESETDTTPIPNTDDTLNSHTNHTYGYSFGYHTSEWLATALDPTKKTLIAIHQTPNRQHVGSWQSTVDLPKYKSENNSYVTVQARLQQFVERDHGSLIMISGHTHQDIAFIDPWLEIMSVCGKFTATEGSIKTLSEVQDYNTSVDEYNADPNNTKKKKKLPTDFIDNLVVPARTLQTYTEDSWSLCIYKPHLNEFDVIRFGAGADRYFHTAPIEPTTLTTKLTGTITWSSSDESVATVVNGVVTAISTGKCAILAKDENSNYECWIIEIN